jgi:hypothetical protein
MNYSAYIIKLISGTTVHATSTVFGSRDSSVGITTGYGVDYRRSITGMVRIFYSPQRRD